MWYKTFKTKLRNTPVDILIYLDVSEDGDYILQFQSMLNDYFLNYNIFLDEDMGFAKNMIEGFPLEPIKQKMLELADEVGAFN